MKKLLAILLTALMLLTSVAALAENTYEPGEYTLPIVSEPLTLVWMGRDSEDAGTSFNNGNALIWNEIMKETGITIEWDVVPNAEYRQIMDLRLASPTGLPDIVCLQGTADGAHLVKYYEEGLLVDITEYLEYAPNLQRLFETYPAYKDAITLPDGAIVALGDLNASNYRVNMPQIRYDWMEKLGIESVSNADELYEAAKAFMEQDPNGNGEADEFGFVAGSMNEYRQLGSLFGLSLITGSGWHVEDGVVVNELVSEEYRDFLTWMNKAYTEGLIPKDFASVDSATKDARIASDVAGIVCRQGATTMLEWNNPTNSVQVNAPGSVWIPLAPKADENYTPVYPLELTASIWRSYAITTDCKDIIAAVRLMDYMLYGEGYYLNTCGIEGLNYYLEDGYVVTIDGWKDKLQGSEFIGTNYFARITADDRQLAGLLSPYLKEDTELRDWSKERLDDAIEIVYTTFQPPIPTNDEAVEIARLTGDMTTYRDEMFVKFVTSETPLSEYDNYVQNYNQLGAERIREIYQSGYDAKNK